MADEARIAFALTGLREGWLSLSQALSVSQLSAYDLGALLARLD